jgi:hypothetical protein
VFVCVRCGLSGGRLSKSGPCEAEITVCRNKPIRPPRSRIFKHKYFYNTATTTAFNAWNSDQSPMYQSCNIVSFKNFESARYSGIPPRRDHSCGYALTLLMAVAYELHSMVSRNLWRPVVHVTLEEINIASIELHRSHNKRISNTIF